MFVLVATIPSRTYPETRTIDGASDTFTTRVVDAVRLVVGSVTT